MFQATSDPDKNFIKYCIMTTDNILRNFVAGLKSNKHKKNEKNY